MSESFDNLPKRWYDISDNVNLSVTVNNAHGHSENDSRLHSSGPSLEILEVLHLLL